jgi:hypothetical protein
MRLLVVSGSPPKISFSTPRQARIAPQPPGPGLPEQAPSVWISTRAGAPPSRREAIGAGTGRAAMEAQLGEVFERVFWGHEGAGALVEAVVEPRQQEAQGGAAGRA